MNKRGIGLSFEVLVVAIIVLVVLGVVIAIFITQSGKYAEKYSDIAEEAEKKCSRLFGRYCAADCGDDRDLGVSEECEGKRCCEKIQNE